MNKNILAGIDIGTTTIRIIVVEILKGEKNPKIIAISESESKGIRHGYIQNIPEAIISLKKAIQIAEKNSGIKIKKALISIGGKSLKSEIISSGEIIISKADGEITNLDINKALKESENNLNLNNKKIIHAFPISFKLDGKEIEGRIQGMHGTRLEIKTMFITSNLTHWEDLIEIITEVNIDIINIIAAPLAISYLALNEKQKKVGCALVNIGSETTSLAVFENDLLIFLNTFSIGSVDITNDIALGLMISLEKAEICKIENNLKNEYPKKKFEEIIKARLSDIFELIENNLKKIKRNELLPAGIIFTGGGSNTPQLENLSKNFLKLPSQIANTEIFGSSRTKLKDNAWFVCLGLILYEQNNNSDFKKYQSGFLKEIKNSIKATLKQLMP